MQPRPEIQEILILEPDRMCAAVLARTAEQVFPDAQIQSEMDPSMAAAALADRTIDLFVVTVRSFDLDIITLLGVWADQPTRGTRVLVVTPNGNSAPLAAVRMLPISGIFDWGRGDLCELEFALRVVATGSNYWSRAVRKPVSATALREDSVTPWPNETPGTHDDGSMPPRFPQRSRPPRW
ncbi:MAG TPA: hypothetical protein VHE61_02630 [Opitutaceae bacterium]|nr:hypothetical protein [Opitutaceae bacterium]